MAKGLLACGFVSSALYLVMNVVVPLRYEGYSVMSQTVSELSAIGAPTRPLWVLLATAYGLLVAFFGWGIWSSAGPNGRLRALGALTLAHGLIGFLWPPMHLRGADMTMTDIMHIAFAIVTLALMLSSIVLGAAALGGRFRLYSAATVVTFLVFGALTAVEAPNIASNGPTPWIGVWERINIAAYMAWIAALSIALIRRLSPRRTA